MDKWQRNPRAVSCPNVGRWGKLGTSSNAQSSETENHKLKIEKRKIQHSLLQIAEIWTSESRGSMRFFIDCFLVLPSNFSDGGEGCAASKSKITAASKFPIAFQPHKQTNTNARRLWSFGTCSREHMTEFAVWYIIIYIYINDIYKYCV